MLSESVLKIDVCQYLEEQTQGTNYTDLSHIVDVLAGFSRFWGKRIEDLFLLVFTRKLGSASRPLMAFIHILNMPRGRNGNFLCLHKFILFVQCVRTYYANQFCSVKSIFDVRVSV